MSAITAAEMLAASAAGRASFKLACRVVATAPITLSGLQTIDGVTLASGDRVLVVAQAAGRENGIYLVAAGAWSRAPEMRTSERVTFGSVVYIYAGTVGAGTLYALTAPTSGTVLLGSTALTFTQTALGAAIVSAATPAPITGAATVGVGTAASRDDHAHRLGLTALTGSSGTMSSLSLDYEVDQSGSAVGYGLHIQADESVIGASHVPVRVAGTAGGEYFSVARAAGVNTVAFLGSSMTLQADGLITLASGVVLAADGSITTPALTIDDTGGITLAASAGGLGLVQAQASSGAGQAGVIRAQRGAAGSVGGSLTIGGGYGGTSGTNLAGDTIVDLGAAVGNNSAVLSVGRTGTQSWAIGNFAGSSYLRAGTGAIASGNTGLAACGIESASMTLVASLGNFIFAGNASSSRVQLSCGASGAVDLQTAAVTACAITPRPTGACAVTWVQSITSLTDTIAAKTSDAAPAARVLEGQSALAGASTNLVGGSLELVSGARATAAGGAPGAIVRRFGSLREIREYAQDDIETTDATVTTAIAYTLGSGRAVRARASVVLRNAATGDVRSWELLATVKDTAGTAAIVGSVTSAHDQGDAGLSTAVCTLDASGGDLRLRVTGIAATTLSWRCVLEVVK